MLQRGRVMSSGMICAACWAASQGAAGGGLPDRPTSIAELLALADRPAVIAHRGFSAARPENTLAAVRAAIEVGADMVEVDVTLSSDRRVVCIHDDTVDRTTDGSGPVMELSLDALRRLDAGSWFSPDWAGQRIPTLNEVLEACRGRILVNIEIKSEAVTPAVEGGIADRVVRQVRNHSMTDHVIISSFEPRALLQVRAVDSGVVTASLFSEDIHSGRAPSEIVTAVGSSALNISRKRATPALVAECRGLGIPVGVYTVNEPDEMRAMIRLGVGAIFTDHPDRLMEVLRERPGEPE